MRISVYDYSGHPGQAQLSRALARRGHLVTHGYCSSYTTGRGRVHRVTGDPENLVFRDVRMVGTFRRYAPVARLSQELMFGFRLYLALAHQRPNVVLLSNVPLVAHTIACALLCIARIPQVIWQQDIYSEAVVEATALRYGSLGRLLVGSVARILEREIVRHSERIVCIDATFAEELGKWGIEMSKVSVIPNWGPIAEIALVPKDNAWARKRDLSDREVVMYAGTLGLKHDPSVLLEIAQWMRRFRPDARMVVISEGRGREWLESQSDVRAGLPQLVLLDFQPYEDLSAVLGTADILVAILERSASRFSVPSKVLTYLCAGKAILAVMPVNNSAAKVVVDAGGIVVDPANREDLRATVSALLGDRRRLAASSMASRSFAERVFNLEKIATDFEQILLGAARSARVVDGRSWA